MRPIFFIVCMFLPFFAFSQDFRPLYAIDGVFVDMSYDVDNELSMDQIESVSLFKVNDEIIDEFNLEFQSVVFINLKRMKDGFVIDDSKILSDRDQKFITIMDGKPVKFNSAMQISPELISSITVRKDIFKAPVNQEQLDLMVIKTKD